MGAMTANRKPTEECMNVNLTNSDSPQKLERARVSVSVSDAMGNVLAEKEKEEIEVDAETESEEPRFGSYEDSSVEEARGDGDKVVRVQHQSQSTLSFDSEVTNAELKVVSGGKVCGSETQRDLENVNVYKKLLEDVGRRSGTLQRLNYEIELNEKRRDYSSATSAVGRLSRYPKVHAPLAREVHAPCRPQKLERARVSVSVSNAMGNVLAEKYNEAKRSASAKWRILVEKGKEVIEVDAETESEEPRFGSYEDSSVEEYNVCAKVL